jgi:hypothetical protein
LFTVFDDVTMPCVVRLKSAVRTVAGDALGFKSGAKGLLQGSWFRRGWARSAHDPFRANGIRTRESRSCAKRERPLGRPLEGKNWGGWVARVFADYAPRFLPLMG